MQIQIQKGRSLLKIWYWRPDQSEDYLFYKHGNLENGGVWLLYHFEVLDMQIQLLKGHTSENGE